MENLLSLLLKLIGCLFLQIWWINPQKKSENKRPFIQNLAIGLLEVINIIVIVFLILALLVSIDKLI